MPYPVISELKVAFVYRLRSIDDKYQREDQRKIIQMQQLELQRNDEDALKQARRDSLGTARQARRDSVSTARKAHLDSLKAAKDAKRDSTVTAADERTEVPATATGRKGGIKGKVANVKAMKAKSGKDKAVMKEDEE